MIRHSVFVRIDPAAHAARWPTVVSGLHDLRDQIAGLLAVHAGDNVSPERGMDKGFETGFILDFIDVAARDEYSDHADHVALSAEILRLAGGPDGVFVFDMELGVETR